MKLYTARSGAANKQVAIKGGVGLMIADHWTDPQGYPFFAIDNGCYSAYARGIRWDPAPFLHSLHKAQELGLKPDFAVLPDIVAGGEASLEKSRRWHYMLSAEYPEIPFYIAVQDGMQPGTTALPEIGIKGIFVGGTKSWKLRTMSAWVEYAHRRGIGIHVGRMGSLEDILGAHNAGADSIDSTTWVQRNGMLERRIREYREAIA